MAFPSGLKTRRAQELAFGMGQALALRVSGSQATLPTEPGVKSFVT